MKGGTIIKLMKVWVCPHVTELPGGLEFWEGVARELQRATGEEVRVISAKDYSQQRSILEREDPEICYVDPILAHELCHRGYTTLAKLKGDEDRFVLVGYSLGKGTPTVAVADLELHFLSVLYLPQLDLLRARVEYLPTQREVYRWVKEGRVDVGVIYKEVYEGIADPQKVPVLMEVTTGLYHPLLVKTSLYERVKEAIRGIGAFEVLPGGPSCFCPSVAPLPVESIVKVKELFDVAKAVQEVPFVGVLIYRDRIVYADESLQRSLGYSLEELRKMSVEELVEESRREELREVMRRRLEGEVSTRVWEDIEVRAKDGSRRYFMVFGSPIHYGGVPSGFVLAVDVTKRRMYEKLYETLKEINKLMAVVSSEEELYGKVCEVLVRGLEIEFAQVEVLSKGERFSFGSPEKLRSGSPPSAVVPIRKRGEVVATLSLYSSEPNLFSEENFSLKELEADLNLTVERLDALKVSLLLEEAVEKSSDVVLITDERGNIEYVNDRLCEITGYTKEELIGQNPRIFKSGYHSQDFYRELWDTILAGKEFHGIFVNRRKDGELYTLEEKIIPVRLPEGLKLVAVGRDLTKEQQLLEEINRLRFYDPLTGLYNVGRFKAEVDEYLRENLGRPSVLVLVDVANLSYINKNFSVEVGDRVLKELISALRESLRESDILGRVGGDEFGVFVKGMRNKEDAYKVILKLKDAITQKEVRVGDRSLVISFNMGVAVYPDDGKTLGQLLESASLALKEAKEEGVNVVKFFGAEMEEKVKGRISAEELIGRAVRENLFLMHYQPYFDTRTGHIAGFEALIRIKEKDGRLHYPKEFIDVLEASEHLTHVREWALEEVAGKIRSWKKPVSLNVTPRTFRDPRFLEEVLERSRELPSALVIEITERSYMEEPERSREIVELLKSSGKVKVAIDDFGTGYSSLSYLKDITADLLKIDISFVRNIVKDERSRLLVKAIVEIARAFGMETVAEGVETKEQYEILKGLGVDYVQGYYLAKPMPPEEVEELLKGL